MKLRDFKRQLGSRLPVPLLRMLRYRRETLFASGLRSYHSTRPSVLFFTTHKCASTFMRGALALVNRQCLGLTQLNLAGYLWDTGADRNAYALLSREPERYLKDHGILYAPLRRYVPCGHLRQARVFGMLRDPRDVAVSGYYSALYSHRPPAHRGRQTRYQERRNQRREISLPDYALAYAERLKPIYASYRESIPRERILTYEDMHWRFDDWVGQMGRILDFPVSDELSQGLARLADAGRPSGEDISSLRRKGTPGDHREKLPPEIVERLTALFHEDLVWLYGDGFER